MQKLSALIDSVKHAACDQLSQLCSSALDQLDDLFFERADKAQHNAEQMLYFQSMRELRAKRQALEVAFKKQLSLAFDHLANSDQISKKTGQPQTNKDQLELVKHEHLEESLAIKGMINKARLGLNESLFALGLRLEAVVKPVKVTDENNPLDPQQVCQAFSDSSTLIDFEQPAKLLLYRVFEKKVVNHLAQVVQQANQILVEEGKILPDLSLDKAKTIVKAPDNNKGSAKTPENNTQATTQAPESPAVNQVPSSIKNSSASSTLHPDSPGGVPQDQVFDELQSLLAKVRGVGQSVNTTAPLNVMSESVDFGNVNPVDSDELVDLLSTLQQKSVPKSDRDLAQPVSSVDVKQLLSQVMELNHQAVIPAIGQVNDDIIDLVSRLFDFISEDHRLSIPMQALLGRLQIPILKVAIKDNTLFSNGNHPARQLLNTLARSGIGWEEASDKQRDSLYKEIDNIVRRILQEFTGDISLFDELLNNFKSLEKQENKRAELVEQRTRNTEQGMAKSEKAWAIVNGVLQHKLAAKTLPEFLEVFIKDIWGNVLYLCCLRDGIDSKQWSTLDYIVDQLIWVAQPNWSPETKSMLKELAPKMMETIKHSLQSMHHNPFEINQFLEQLYDVFEHNLAGPDSIDSKTKIRLNTSNIPTPTKKVENTQLASIKGSTLSQGGGSALERQRARETAILQEFYRQVDQLNAGTWLQFTHLDGSRQRCKLSTILSESDTFIFVNRRGVKVLEKSRDELAYEMRRGRVEAFDDGLLFDRALDNVFTSLRSVIKPTESSASQKD